MTVRVHYATIRVLNRTLTFYEHVGLQHGVENRHELRAMKKNENPTRTKFNTDITHTLYSWRARKSRWVDK